MADPLFVQVTHDEQKWMLDMAPLRDANPWAPFDGNIRFDEARHKYAVRHDGVWREYDTSVTGLIGSHFKEFDSDGWAKRCAGTRNYPDMTVDQVKEQWRLNGEKQSRLGTVMHECIEYEVNGLPAPHTEMLASPEYGYYLQFKREFVDEHKLLPIRSELRTFDRRLQLAGTIDMVYRREGAPEGEYILVDWKRSKKMMDPPRDPAVVGRPPFQHLSQCDLNKYTLQLNAYKKIIERNCPGVTISDMFLARFHPILMSYQVVQVRDEMACIERLFEKREALLEGLRKSALADEPFVADAKKRKAGAEAQVSDVKKRNVEPEAEVSGAKKPKVEPSDPDFETIPS